MGKEIERKYLVKKDEWQSYKHDLSVTGTKYRQGYIPTGNTTTVRLRTIDKQGYITIKGKTTGYTRSEFEYPIPIEDAEEMLSTLCLEPSVEKIRYKVNLDNLTWEVDEFFGDNTGLIIAEVELENEEQQVNLPNWIDKEVNDKKYFNASLVKHPYSQWQDKS